MKPSQLLFLVMLGAQTLAVGAGPAPPGNAAEQGSPAPSGKTLTSTAVNPLPPGEGLNRQTIELGRKIYLEGIRENGKRLVGKRAGGTQVSGMQAACVTCHRRSGLGGVEGQYVIPPINGRALFGGGEPVVVQEDQRFNTGLSVPHAPYTDKSLATAMRKGRHVSGREMSELMPRYALSDKELKAVTAYVRTLSIANSQGVDDKLIHLATVIAPGVSQARRKVFLDTLTAMLNQFNVNVKSGQRQRIPAIERRLHTRRMWSLEVWELSGPSDTWAAQLDRRQAQNPAFAILSGLGQGEWQPVHDFCERSKVVCWFPSIDLAPAGADQGNYGIYFSRGVELEADVVAHRLTDTKPNRVLQVYGPDTAAQAAKAKLHKSLDVTGIAIRDLEWNPQQPEPVATAIKGLAAGDALMLWLRPDALQALGSIPAPSAAVYVSTTLNGGESLKLPVDWRKNAWLVDLQELPKMRTSNLKRFRSWIEYRSLPLTDEKMQSEVYFAVNSLSWMIKEMLNNLHTDYLIERAEATLSMREAMEVQMEVQSMMMGGGGRRPPSTQRPAAAKPVADGHSVDMEELMKRQGTTVYPRLSLGPGQRFTAKGAYLLRVNPADGGLAVKTDDAEWIVP